ncbi:MAG: LexA family transcriptional regulator [Edaphocola sp.]
MENFLPQNLRFLRKKKGVTQADIHDSIGFVKNTWSNWENAKSQPSIENIIIISQYFDISIEKLISEDLNNVENPNKSRNQKNVVINVVHDVVNHPKKEAVYVPAEDAGGMGFVAETVPVMHPLSNVFDFEGAASAGSALSLLREDKYRVAPTLYMPWLGPGTHVRTPVSGDSMHSTIKDGDRAVSTLLHSPNDIRAGYIYLVVDKEDGLVYKRLYPEGGGMLDLVSDNEVYKPYKRHLDDILAIFRVREITSTDLRPYCDDIRREMREIRTEMADLRRKIGA